MMAGGFYGVIKVCEFEKGERDGTLYNVYWGYQALLRLDRVTNVPDSFRLFFIFIIYILLAVINTCSDNGIYILHQIDHYGKK